jgi:hypothetical protein
MASVNFDNGSTTELSWYFSPGKLTGQVKGYSQSSAIIPDGSTHYGLLIKTSFTGLVYVKKGDPPYALQIYAWPDSSIGNAPAGNAGTSVTWINNSGGPLTWFVKSSSGYGGASLGTGAYNRITQQLPVNPTTKTGCDPKARWGWKVANFTGRLLFSLDGFTLIADNQRY